MIQQENKLLRKVGFNFFKSRFQLLSYQVISVVMMMLDGYDMI